MTINPNTGTPELGQISVAPNSTQSNTNSTQSISYQSTSGPITVPVSSPANVSQSSSSAPIPSSVVLTPAQQAQQQQAQTATSTLNTPPPTPGANATLQPKSPVNQYGSPTTGYFSTPEEAANAASAALKGKYSGFVTAKGSSEAPATGSAANAAINSYTASLPTAPTLAGSGEAVNTAYQQLIADTNGEDTLNSNLESVQKYQNDQSQALGIPTLELQAADLNTMINGGGNENNITQMITAAGGTASETQIEGLTATANKATQLQLTNVQNALIIAQNQLSQNVSGFQADQGNALNSFKTKVSNDNNVLTLAQSAQSQVITNYQKVLSSNLTPYSALVQYIGPSNPQALTDAETYLGLGKGTLSDPTQVQSLDAYNSKLLTLQATIAKDNTQAGYYDARTLSTNVGGVQSIISNFTSLPSYQLLSNAQPYLARIEAAAANPSAVNDTDLLDSLTSLETGGGRVTEAQINTTLQGTNYADQVSVLQNKITAQGGVLSPDQRSEVQTLANNIYAKYQQAYEPSYTASLDAIHSQYGNQYDSLLPNLDSLSTVGAAGSSATISTQGKPVTIGGNNYTVGSPITTPSLPGVQLTPTAQGTFSGSDGNTYDSDGNIIQ